MLCNIYRYILGWAQWNLSRFEFKFDDTRLSSLYKNKIGLIEILFFLLPDVALFLPCWLSQLNFSKLRQPTGQRHSNVRTQQNQISIRPILFLYYEGSLVPSNLNSKLFMFHCVRPSIYYIYYSFEHKFYKCDFKKSMVLYYPEKQQQSMVIELSATGMLS